MPGTAMMTQTNSDIAPPIGSINELNPGSNPSSSAISAIASVLLNNTLNPGTGGGLSPQNILDQVQNLQLGGSNAPAGSNSGLSQILNFGKSLLEKALNAKTSTNTNLPSGIVDVPPDDTKVTTIDNNPQKTIDITGDMKVNVPDSTSMLDKKTIIETRSGSITDPNKDVYPKGISGPINPSDVKTIQDPNSPGNVGPMDKANPLNPLDVKPLDVKGPGVPLDVFPIDVNGLEGNMNVGTFPQPGDIIRPEDGLHIINPITGLPEFPHAKPIGVVSPSDVLDRGHVHADGTFHDFPVELHGNDGNGQNNVLSVLDPVTGQTVAFPAIDGTADHNHKGLDPTEVRAAWLMERKRAMRLRNQNKRLRDLLRQHMNEVHPSEIVPVDETHGLKPGDVIPIGVIPSVPEPDVKIPGDLGVPEPEPEPVIPGISIGPVEPEPGDAIPVIDVIPDPMISSGKDKYIPPIIGGRRPLKPGDVIPVGDVIPTVPGYIPSPDVIVSVKDKHNDYTGQKDPVIPGNHKNPDTFILPATPEPVIRVPPTTPRPEPRPQPPPPPPRRPPPPPPQKKNNLLANLGIGFAIGSLLFGK